jgi:hypothetical protein
MKQLKYTGKMRRIAPTSRKVLPMSQPASGISEWRLLGEH